METTFLSLPNELFLCIAQHLEYQSEVSSLSRTNRRLHGFLEPLLYEHDSRYHQGSALSWGVRDGFERTIKLARDAGALAFKDNSLRELLRSAAFAGHLDLVKMFWEQRVSLYQTYPGKNNTSLEEISQFALSTAVHAGHTAIVKFLLESSVVLDNGVALPPLATAVKEGLDDAIVSQLQKFWELDSDRLLHSPARHGQLELVQLLLDNGVRPKTTSECTALEDAAFSGNLDVVKLLLDHGADPYQHALRTLAKAAVQNHQAVVDYLVDRVPYAEVVRKPQERIILLRVAAACGKVELARQLLDSGVGADAEGYWAWPPHMSTIKPLAVAAERGHVEMVKFLISRGANPNKYTREEMSHYPLLLAIFKGHEEVVRVLLDHGANPTRTDATGWPVTYTARCESMFKLLLDRGVLPTLEHPEYEGPCVICPMVKSSSTSLLLWIGGLLPVSSYSQHPLLLEKIRKGGLLLLLALEPNALGLDAVVDSLDPEIAVHRAAAYNRLGVMETLLDRGFPPNAEKEDPRPLLTTTAMADDPRAGEMVRRLIELGADLEESDAKGETPLLETIRMGYSRAVGVLLEHGANPLHADNAGNSALFYAMNCPHMECLRLVLQAIESRGIPLSQVQDQLEQAKRRERVPEYNLKLKALRQAYWRMKYPVPVTVG